MALDGLYLRALIKELKDTLIDTRVDKITQPEKDEIILSFKINRKNVRLLLSANASYPRVNFIDYTKESPMKAPVFCMVLRKYLNTAVVKDIRQLNNDRVMMIDFESSDELGFNSIYTLMVEIMGRHSNITLIRERDGLVMDCVKHITPDINSYRVLYPGVNYVYPPASNKADIFEASFEGFKEKVLESFTEEAEINEKFFTKVVDGIGAPAAKEILFKLKEKNMKLSVSNLKEVYDFLVDFFSGAKSGEYVLGSYTVNGELKDFHCIKLDYLLQADGQFTTFESASALLEGFYHARDKVNRLQGRSHDMQKLVNNNIDRLEK
ncbi:MAG: NFACT family protein, partial [Clostridium sp.]